MLSGKVMLGKLFASARFELREYSVLCGYTAAMCEKWVDCSSAGMIEARIAHYNWIKVFLEIKSSKKLENMNGQALDLFKLVLQFVLMENISQVTSSYFVKLLLFRLPNENVSQSFSIIGSAELAKKSSLRQHRQLLPHIHYTIFQFCTFSIVKIYRPRRIESRSSFQLLALLTRESINLM